MEAQSLKQMVENGLNIKNRLIRHVVEENQEHPSSLMDPGKSSELKDQGTEASFFLVSNLPFTLTFGFSWQTITLSGNKLIAVSCPAVQVFRFKCRQMLIYSFMPVYLLRHGDIPSPVNRK